MTDPRQPNSWSSRYPATYQASNGVNGFAPTDLDDLDGDLEGLGQDDEIGIPRAGTNGAGGANRSAGRYWQAPHTLAPDYDEPSKNDSYGASYRDDAFGNGAGGARAGSDYSEAETQQGLSAPGQGGSGLGGSGLGGFGSGGSGMGETSTAWWKDADQPGSAPTDRAGGEQHSTGRDLAGSLDRGLDSGSEDEDWSSRLTYDSDATVLTSALPDGSASAGPVAGGSVSGGSAYGSESASAASGGSASLANGSMPIGAYPASEGYSVGSVASAASAATTTATRAETTRAEKGTGPRRARLMLRHIDPLSTLKFTLVLTIALFVVWMVAVGVLYGVLNGMGVFDKINNTINDVNGSNSDVITAQIVFGAAAVIGAINIVLFTALATVGSFIYNLCADMVGGLELTLAEHD